MTNWKNIKYYVIFTVIVVFLIWLGWVAFSSDKGANALIVTVFGFCGFYISEVAKQAIKARHTAGQAWAYILSRSSFLKSKLIGPDLESFGKGWYEERVKSYDKGGTDVVVNHDFSVVDNSIRDKIVSVVNKPGRVEYYAEVYRAHVQGVPGRSESHINFLEGALDDFVELIGNLSDADMALLGSRILTHWISFRTALRCLIQSELSIHVHVRECRDGKFNLDYLKNTSIELMYWSGKSQVELETLKPLISQAQGKNLIQHSVTLLGVL